MHIPKAARRSSQLPDRQAQGHIHVLFEHIVTERGRQPDPIPRKAFNRGFLNKPHDSSRNHPDSPNPQAADTGLIISAIHATSMPGELMSRHTADNPAANEVSYRTPSRGVNDAARVIYWLIIAAGWTCSGGLLLKAVYYASPNDLYLLAIFLLFGIGIWFAAVAHEMGHAVAARFGGMTVLSLQVGALQWAPTRGGGRFRWQSGTKPRLGGSALAIADLRRPLRGQHICYAIGGPAANLTIALMLALLVTIAWPNARPDSMPLADVALAVAAYNAAIGIANLIPFAGAAPSDGLQALQWARTNAGATRVHAYQHLVACSIRGVPEQDIPEELTNELASLPSPFPLVSIQVRLKASQNLALWSRVHALEAELDAKLEALSPHPASRDRDLISIVRAEIAFSKAMDTDDHRFLSDGLLTRGADWWQPSLWPRLLALRSALVGDASACERELASSLRWAKKSLHRSVLSSELLLHQYVREKVRKD